MEFRYEERRFAARGIDDAGCEAERGKGRRQLVVEIGVELVLALGIEAFCPVRHPAVELREKLARLEVLAGTGGWIIPGPCAFPGTNEGGGFFGSGGGRE